ncbi:LolA family protein [Sulfobacillus harzensis]|uniref:MucB/RseB N-terminal domain-containing protein n=1 Tax=Sulfobacillus harzensis TaxID=2729629 RepID=A0A7Y0L4S5_9FIRM|nr:hypothetical protein [Sulfobacillus harzensis]NMP22395.1 hypothetical protein [Sulfobacillus harzensis]
MDRKKWYAIAVLAGGAAALTIYLAPYAEARQSLAPLGVNAILTKSWSSMEKVSFGETLSYQNSLLPPGTNLAGLFNLPLPGVSVTTINLYQNAPTSWRLEELNQGGTVVGVLARSHNALVTYRSASNERTMNHLPSFLRSPWSVWQIPEPTVWQKEWVGRASRTRVAGVPAYQVTLTPKNHKTLWGTITYWFQGQYFVPLGVQVTDRRGDTVFEAKATIYTQGAPGASARPPSAGRLVDWRPTPALANLSHTLSGPKVPFTFPPQLGSLVRVSQRRAGGNALAVYGTGPGRVVVLITVARPFHGKDASRILKPVAGDPGFRGVTDGVFSVVTFRRHQHEITLIGSRSQSQLARWAKEEWH